MEGPTWRARRRRPCRAVGTQIHSTAPPNYGRKQRSPRGAVVKKDERRFSGKVGGIWGKKKNQLGEHYSNPGEENTNRLTGKSQI